MKKTLVTAISLALLGTVWSASAFASSKLVTPDVPLTSRYYSYIDKLEAMGFITDMSSSTKPYSRLEVAKMLAKVNPQGMQPYLKVWYDEMCDEFSDEIAYIIVHRPVVQEVTLKKNSKAKTKVVKLNRKSKNKANNTEFVTNTMSTNDGQTVNVQLVANGDQILDSEEAAKAAKHHQEYYADKHNWLVAEKVKLASPKHFPSNVKLRRASVELSEQSMDTKEYAYRRTNASYQPLHGYNNGYRYGDGFNAVGKLEISGSLSEQLALNVSPRFSWDKDAKGKASLEEGYVRTHLGMWNITAGKQALNWGSQLGAAGISVSNNSTPHTMVRIGLMDKFQFSDTVLNKLGKIDFQFFISELEHNRRTKLLQWKPLANPKYEYDKGKFWGMRFELQPVDCFTIGFERISMLKKFDKNYFFIRNDGVTADGTDNGNDQNGIDWRWKFPGVQIYGSMYGEDGTTDIGDLFMSNKSKRFGIYFPQLAKDGSWDLQLEYTKNSEAWYYHGSPFSNGWSYKENIMGDAMGNEAKKFTANINNYLRNGDILGFSYMDTKWDTANSVSPQYREYKISYSHKLKEGLHLDTAVGLADISNSNYVKGKNEKSKFIAASLNWEY